MLWRSEIHINLKIDADVLNRRRCRFCVRRKTYHIYQCQRRQYSGKCACVYGVCSVKNKIVNEINLTDFQPNLNSSNSSTITVCTKTQRIRAVLFQTCFTTLWRSEIHINLKIDADALNRRRRRFRLRRTVYHIYQRQGWQCAGKCAHIYDVHNVKNKIRNWDICYRQYFKWTTRHPNWPSPSRTQYLYPIIVECFLYLSSWGMRRTYAHCTSKVENIVLTTGNTSELHSAFSKTLQNGMVKPNSYKY
jgi:hypothetical protein